jgi:hypothetical protein
MPCPYMRKLIYDKGIRMQEITVKRIGGHDVRAASQ